MMHRPGVYKPNPVMTTANKCPAQSPSQHISERLQQLQYTAFTDASFIFFNFRLDHRRTVSTDIYRLQKKRRYDNCRHVKLAWKEFRLNETRGWLCHITAWVQYELTDGSMYADVFCVLDNLWLLFRQCFYLFYYATISGTTDKQKLVFYTKHGHYFSQKVFIGHKCIDVDSYL